MIYILSFYIWQASIGSFGVGLSSVKLTLGLGPGRGRIGPRPGHGLKGSTQMSLNTRRTCWHAAISVAEDCTFSLLKKNIYKI